MIEIENININQIYDFLKDILVEIYEKFNYLELSQKEFKKIVLKEIETSLQFYDKKESYTEYIQNKIILKLEEKVKIYLQNNDKAKCLINNYINENLQKVNNKKKALKELEKLNGFLKKYNFTPSSELFIELLENKLLADLLINVKSNNIDDVNIQTLVNAYYLINDFQENSDDIKDSLSLYLIDISKYPLLSKEEERKLANKVAMGDEVATQKFIESNLRLVVKIAKNYINCGLSYADLIQEGNIGLIKAVEKFKTDKGTKFSTYATFWIKQSITRAIEDKGKLIRIPTNLIEDFRKIQKIKTELENELNREVTIDELVQMTKISPKKLKLFVEYKYEICAMDTLYYSGEYNIGEQSVEDLCIENNLNKEVSEFLQSCELTEKELTILYMHYGLNNSKIYTLEQIGQKYNMTRERVRQIETEGIKKIKKSTNITQFACYMDYPEKAIANVLDSKDTKINRGTKKLKTIYELLDDFSKIEIDALIKTLSMEEQKLIYYRYGNDLENPVYGNVWNNELSYELYNILIPRMKKSLSLKIDINKIVRRGNANNLVKALNEIEETLEESSVKINRSLVKKRG